MSFYYLDIPFFLDYSDRICLICWYNDIISFSKIYVYVYMYRERCKAGVIDNELMICGPYPWG